MSTMLRTFSLVALTVVAVVPLTGCGGASPGGGTGGTTVTITTVGSVPWMAAQDGSGSWKAVTGTSFDVTDTSGDYGFAWECPVPSGQQKVTIVQATTAESTTLTASCQLSGGTPTPFSVSGNVAGIPTGGSAFVAVGYDSTTVSDTAPGFYLSNFAAGVNTELAYGLDSGGAPTGMVLNRGVDVNADMTWNPDVSTGTSFSLNTLSVTGVPSGEASDLRVVLEPAGGGILGLAQATAANLAYPVIPPSLAQSGDEYVVDVSTFATDISQTVVTVAQSPSSATNLAVPSALASNAGVGVAGGTATATWGSVSFPSSGGSMLFSASVQPASTSAPWWLVEVSRGWLGSATTYAFADPSAAAGWDASWDFPTGQSAFVNVSVDHTTMTLEQLVALGQSWSVASLPDGTMYESTAKRATGTY